MDFLKAHQDHDCFEGAGIHQIFEAFVEFYQKKKKEQKFFYTTCFPWTEITSKVEKINFTTVSEIKHTKLSPKNWKNHFVTW